MSGDRFLSLPRRLFVLLALGAVSVLSGCGGLGFSGGGVPVGGLPGSRLAGRVVAAASPSSNLGGAELTLQATPAGGVTQTMHATSASDGTFEFRDVLAGAANGAVMVMAAPPNTNYGSQNFAFQLVAGKTDQMIVSLPPASFQSTQAARVSLSLSASGVRPGTSVKANADLEDAQGGSLHLSPSLLFDGNFGTLQSDGTLTIPGTILAGSGTITAFWESLPPRSVPIHIDNNPSENPPAAPVVPAPPPSGGGGQSSGF